MRTRSIGFAITSAHRNKGTDFVADFSASLVQEARNGTEAQLWLIKSKMHSLAWDKLSRKLSTYLKFQFYVYLA